MSEQNLIPPEILDQIFIHLTPATMLPIPLNTPCKRDLLSCTLACRAFAPLALGLLWRNMDTLLPLLKLLPRLQLVDNFYVHPNPLTEADLVQYDYYAQFIKVFTHCEPGGEDDDGFAVVPLRKINTSVYHHLSRLRPILLPSLVNLICFASGLCDRIEIDLFVSPSLKEIKIVSINSRQKGTEVLMYLSLLGKEADIQRLALEIELPATPCCLQVVPRLKNLRNLHLEFNHRRPGQLSMILHDIESLRSLEFLNVLYIMSSNNSVDDISETYTPNSPVTPDTFKALKTLSVRGGQYRIIKTMFDLCKYSPIHELGLEPCLGPQMPVLIKQAVDQWSQSLIDIEMYYGSTSQGMVLPILQDIRTLCSLQILRRLRMVSFYLTSCIVNNEDIEAMANAWPNLTELDLMVPSKDSGDSPGVGVLKILAEKCGNLKKIVMPLNLRDVLEPTNPGPLALSSSGSSADTRSGSARRSHGLESFRILVDESLECDTAINPMFIAYYICSAFPDVKEVNGRWHGELGLLWDQIKNAVKILQSQK